MIFGTGFRSVHPPTAAAAAVARGQRCDNMVLPVTLVSWPSQVRGLLKVKAPFLVKRGLQQVAFIHKLTLVNPDIVPIVPAEKH